jgi:hypothetical protein
MSTTLTPREPWHIPTTPAEIWDAYEVDILAAKATLPRSWRAWLHLPTANAARTAVCESALDNLTGVPVPLQAWCVLGALVAGDWRDARSWAGCICERSSGLFHLYLHVSRALAPLAPVGEVLRDLAYCCSPEPLERWLGRESLTLRSRIALLYFRLVVRYCEHPAAPFVLALAVVWPLLWWLLTARH